MATKLGGKNPWPERNVLLGSKVMHGSAKVNQRSNSLEMPCGHQILVERTPDQSVMHWWGQRSCKGQLGKIAYNRGGLLIAGYFWDIVSDHHELRINWSLDTSWSHFWRKSWKKFENQGAPSDKWRNPKWPPQCVKIDIFNLFGTFLSIFPW